MILDTKIQDLPKSIQNIPIRTLESDTPVWLSVAFFALYMGTFSDGIAITENKKLVGYFGSKQVIEYLQEQPTSPALMEKTIKDLPKRDHFVFFSTSNTLSDIFNEWKKSGFAYSAIQNGEEYSAISINSMLGFIELYDLPNKISEIPKKETVTYSNNDTVSAIFDKMLQHKYRRLVLEGTTDVLSDRIIIDAICNEFDYLKKTPDFLSIKAKSFNAKKAMEITQDSKITDVAHDMLRDNHPMMISDGQIITPWDIVVQFFKVMDGK